MLEHLLGEDWQTVPPDRGVFLDRTRRMHPDVCRFVSDVVYDGRLFGIPETARHGAALGSGGARRQSDGVAGGSRAGWRS